MACDDDRITSRQADLRGENQKAKTDCEMWDYEWRQQHAFERPLQGKFIAIEREGEGGTDHERDGGRPSGHDQPVAETGLKVFVFERLDEPSPRPTLGREGQNRLTVECGKGDHERRQHEEGENGDYDDRTDEAQKPLRRQSWHVNAPRFVRAGVRPPASGPAPRT